MNKDITMSNIKSNLGKNKTKYENLSPVLPAKHNIYQVKIGKC